LKFKKRQSVENTKSVLKKHQKAAQKTEKKSGSEIADLHQIPNLWSKANVLCSNI
jgi:hypothetical protein